MKFTRLVLSAVFVLVAGEARCSAADAGIDLFGYTSEQNVKLLWLARGWPDDVVGVQVFRRLQGQDSWKDLSGGTIYPEISYDRSWEHQGLGDAKQVSFYQEKLREYIKQGRLALVERERFLEVLNQIGMRAGDRILFTADYDRAVVSGFAYIDSSVDSDAKYEYGLFGIDSSGERSSLPLSTYITLRVEDAEHVRVKLQAKKSENHVVLGWSSDRKFHDEAGFLTYNIYRRKTEADLWERLIPPSLSPWNKAADVISWKFVDQTWNPKHRCFYAVAPLNKFQKEFEKSWVEYIPEGVSAAELNKLQPVNDLNLIDIKGGSAWDTNEDTARSILVGWEFDPYSESEISGFSVLRSNTVTGVESKVGEMLPPNKRQVLDITPPSKTLFFYRVVTVCEDGSELMSKAREILFKGPKPLGPPAPKNFKVKFVSDKDGFSAKATWEMPDKEEGVTSYRLFRNINAERKLYEDGSKALGVTNAYSWTLNRNTPGHREGVFGIQPVGEKSKRGPRVTDTIFIPRLKAPYLTNIHVKLTPDAAALLSWEYPHMEDLIGFRIYINDKLVADEKAVPPNVRSWQVYDYPDRYDESYSLRFEVEAVFKYCSNRNSATPSLCLSQYRSDRSLRAPDADIWVVGATNETQWVELKWDEYLDPPQDPEIYGYLLELGNDPEFEKNKTLRVKKCDRYYFNIPTDWEGENLYFRCSAQGNHFWGGMADSTRISKTSEYWKDKTVAAEKLKEMKEHNRKYRWLDFYKVISPN